MPGSSGGRVAGALVHYVDGGWTVSLCGLRCRQDPGLYTWHEAGAVTCHVCARALAGRVERALCCGHQWGLVVGTGWLCEVCGAEYGPPRLGQHF